MLILAKKNEKDYYDGVVNTMGVDKTLVYNRQIIEIEQKNFPKFLHHKFCLWGHSKDSPFIKIAYHDILPEYRKKYQEYSHFVVGFCGKLYIGWKLYHNENDPDIIGQEKLITEITYDFDFIKSIIKSHNYWGNIEEDVNKIKNFNIINFFRVINAPVFIYDHDYNRTMIGQHKYRNQPKFIINPLLKKYEFYKVFDAFQAFQEISMFLGGVLGRGEKEIVEVADKYKIEQHGFDKWSFRKEPETKK
jgi:hypothetical protein